MFTRHSRLAALLSLSALLFSPGGVGSTVWAQDTATNLSADQLLGQGQQKYADGDLKGAEAILKRVDVVQLSAENREKLKATLAQIEAKSKGQATTADALAKADAMLASGNSSGAADAYQTIAASDAALPDQKKTAQDKLADIRKGQNVQRAATRQLIDEAASDIAANKLDSAESKLKQVKSSGQELGWFDQQRMDRQFAQIAEKRKESPAAAAKNETKVIAAAPAAAQPAGQSTASDASAVPLKSDGKPDMLAQAARLRAQQKIAEAQQAEAGGHYRAAVDLYREALNMDPGNVRAQEALNGAQSKFNVDQTPVTILDSTKDSIQVQKDAALAEYNTLINRATDLRKARQFNGAAEATNQAKIILDRNARVLSQTQYNTLRDQTVKLSADIADEQRKATEEQVAATADTREKEAKTRRQDALQSRDAEVQRLLKRAWELRLEEKYDQALELVNQAIFLDPLNVPAEAMKHMMEDSRNYVTVKDMLRKRNLIMSNISVDNLDATMPYNELMTYPADWPQLTRRRLRGLSEESGESEANRKVAAKLKEQVPINFEANKLVNVIEFLRNTTGLNFFVNWNALQQVGVEQDAPITLQLSNVPAEKALKLVLQQVSTGDQFNPVSYAIVDGVVTISTQQDLVKSTETRVYDIRDMLHDIKPVAGVPKFDLGSALSSSSSSGGGGSGGGGGGGSSGSSIFSGTGTDTAETETGSSILLGGIIDLITRTVGKPEEWESAGGTVSSLKELNGNLIVKTTSENHRATLELLSKLRETRAMQISVEARFLLVDQNFLDEVGIDVDFAYNVPGGKFGPIKVDNNTIGLASGLNTGLPGNFIGNGARSLEVTASYLDDIQVNLLVRATQANRKSISLTAPRVTFMNGQEAFVTIARQISFISDLTPVPDAQGFDPTLSTVQSGVVLFVRGTISADRRYVTLSVSPSLANVIQPIRTIQQTTIFGVTANAGTTAATATTATTTTTTGTVTPSIVTGFVEAPEVEITQVETTVSVPDKGTLMLGGQRLVGETDVEAGVPVLSKIPIIQRIFTNRSSVKDERTLLILVKPTIIIQSEMEEDLFPGLQQSPAAYGVGRSFQ